MAVPLFSPSLLSSSSAFTSNPSRPSLSSSSAGLLQAGHAFHKLISLPKQKFRPLMLPSCVPESSAAAAVSVNGSPNVVGRFGEVKRVTKETDVLVKLNLDGSGIADSTTSIPFLDHMLDQLASHGLFDVHVRAKGDIHIDDHHTNEDVALAIGTALLQALGDRKGINRFGDFSAPLDEALIHVSLDLSGRPHLSYDLSIPTERVGTYDTQQLAGKNSHHIIEATFKAFARALRQATECDPRRLGTVPSVGISSSEAGGVDYMADVITVSIEGFKGSDGYLTNVLVQAIALMHLTLISHIQETSVGGIR
ncbi:imidazoleglycerol-phosphate dehydratase [Asimina triloba]